MHAAAHALSALLRLSSAEHAVHLCVCVQRLWCLVVSPCAAAAAIEAGMSLSADAVVCPGLLGNTRTDTGT